MARAESSSVLVWFGLPGNIWCSDAGREHGRYAVVQVNVPGLMQRKAFQLRHVDPATARADPFSYGYLVSEYWDLRQAMEAGQRHYYTRVHHKEASVSDDYPGLVKTTFYMPISDGTKRAALVITEAGDGVRVAQVVMMSRGRSDDGSYQPVVVAQVAIPVPENV